MCFFFASFWWLKTTKYLGPCTVCCAAGRSAFAVEGDGFRDIDLNAVILQQLFEKLQQMTQRMPLHTIGIQIGILIHRFLISHVFN